MILKGIEYDAIGRVVAYWMYPEVPGEEGSYNAATPHRVDAAEVLHIFSPDRPGQRRGMSWLAPALPRLDELEKYQAATLTRLSISTAYTATLEPRAEEDNAVDPLTGEAVQEVEGKPVVTVGPGIVQELGVGEKLTFNDPPDPPQGFTEFCEMELRAAGAAVGVPYEAFAHAWGKGMNDRLARIVLAQYRRRVQRFVWALLVPQMLSEGVGRVVPPRCQGAAEEHGGRRRGRLVGAARMGVHAPGAGRGLDGCRDPRGPHLPSRGRQRAGRERGRRHGVHQTGSGARRCPRHRARHRRPSADEGKWTVSSAAGWTIDDLARIRAAIARGETSVTFADRNVQYKNLDALIKTEKRIAEALAGRPRSRTIITGTGFER